MQRPFAVFDIDGTLVRWQLYHAIADSVVRLGFVDKSEFQNVKEARMIWKRRSHDESFKDYEQTLVKAYEKMISQITIDEFNKASQTVFEEFKDQVHTYTRDLIANLKAKNYLLFAISGSQQEIVQMIADYYEFDDYVGSRYIQKAGRFSGEVIVTKDDKHLLLEKMIKKHNATKKDSFAVGDSEGDISLLEVVQNPIAFNPSQKLYVVAKTKNWKIVIERKNVVYELEPSNGSYILA